MGSAVARIEWPGLARWLRRVFRAIGPLWARLAWCRSMARSERFGPHGRERSDRRRHGAGVVRRDGRHTNLREAYW